MSIGPEPPSDHVWPGAIVPDSLIMTSPDGTILRWNAAAHQVYGYSEDHALGRNLDALLASHHPFGLEHIAHEVVSKGEWRGEIFRKTADGRSIGVKAHISRMADTEQRGEWSRPFSSEDFAGDSAHRYVNLFNAMAASFWELDFSGVREELGRLHAQGIADLPNHLLQTPQLIDTLIARVRVLDVNQKTIDLFQLSGKDEALGNTIEWAWPPQSREVFARSLIAALHRDDRFTIETVLRSRTGQLIHVLFTVCWPENHKAQGSVLVGVIDLSETKRAFRELQESEQHYRDLFQGMPVALLRVGLSGLNGWLHEMSSSGIGDLAAHIEVNPDLVADILSHPHVVDANAEALSLFRATDISQLRGPIKWAWKERPGTLRRSLVARLRGAREFSEETKIMRLDGTVVDALYVISFAEDRVDQGYNIVALLDISERKKVEEELRGMREDLSHAARISMLGEMTASIAHEVNQPLGAIAALADASLRWLDRPEPDLAEVRTLARDIASDARRASEIINRIRSLAVKRTASRELLDLNELTQETLLLLRRELDAAEIRLFLDFTARPVPIVADRIQLQQVIVNLLVNAIQAVAQGGSTQPHIRVATAGRDDAMAQLLVEDSGPGIAPDLQASLFDSFVTTKGSGMGLGLSVCRSIVEAHGGTISAENHPLGARFIVSLPCV